jgi:cobalt/nickel transport protein
MKKALSALALILIGLAVVLPFASTSPDGLEKVTETFGVQQQTSFWEGVLPDYSVAVLGNGYISTLIAGVFGIMVVLIASLLLGKVMAKDGKAPKN